ncbi:hypothetical protein DES52_11818 [Deinococcus yavapaiensis KR-236]|uniref:Tetratricopeptide repeat protein n=1 Tax=Deinococcus yavapaiensis KR-236 TaxID=694435 RepID=A0A318S6N9_9DEIO|nr:hypothetical protein DES52_11818 [Deinococcus yavapaiensis KR-236]
MRETLTASLSALRSRLLHRRALEALEGAAPPAVLARHAQLAGRPDAARPWLRRIARDALRLGRGDTAIQALRDALDLGAHGLERLELLVLIAEAYEIHVDPASASQAVDDAVTAAQTGGEPSLLLRALIM